MEGRVITPLTEIMTAYLYTLMRERERERERQRETQRERQRESFISLMFVDFNHIAIIYCVWAMINDFALGKNVPYSK